MRLSALRRAKLELVIRGLPFVDEAVEIAAVACDAIEEGSEVRARAMFPLLTEAAITAAADPVHGRLAVMTSLADAMAAEHRARSMLVELLAWRATTGGIPGRAPPA